MTALSPEQMLFDMLSEEIERIDPANPVLARARRLALRLSDDKPVETHLHGLPTGTLDRIALSWQLGLGFMAGAFVPLGLWAGVTLLIIAVFETAA